MYSSEDVDQVLRLADNMPLAVDLIAHIVDYEGLINALAHWETEKTSLLSIGSNRKSNLDVSISLSLSSPRITSHSKDLLSLLALLPNGLSDVELVKSNLGIPNILSCKAALQATSLVYQDANKRLRLLMPVKEHIKKFLPPSQPLIQSIRTYFHALLKLYQQYTGDQAGQKLKLVLNQTTLNLGNMQEVLGQGLCDYNPNLANTIYCTLSLNLFYRATGRGRTLLMDYIQPFFPCPCDHHLESRFLAEVFNSPIYSQTPTPLQLIDQAIAHFHHIDDPLLECKLPAFSKQLFGLYNPQVNSIR
jgi:hypothetical protein